MMLATSIENTLGRFWLSSDAVCPAAFAALKICWAWVFSLICATSRRSPMLIVTALTAARVEPGKMYLALIGARPSLR